MIRSVLTQVILQGSLITPKSWSVTLGAYGSLAQVTVVTSIALLSVQGIDVVALAETEGGAEIQVLVGYQDASGNQIGNGGGQMTMVFDGLLDKDDWNVHGDTVTLRGRDFGSILVDNKQILAGLNYKNRTIGQIAMQIAQLANLGTDLIQDPGTMAGVESNGEHVLMTHPQPLWNVLQNLAQQVGWDVYVTPQRDLFFGPPSSVTGDVTITWGAQPNENPVNPLLELDISHSPRRNGDFEVRVMTYHPKTAQIAGGRAAPTTTKLAGTVIHTPGHTVVSNRTGQVNGLTGSFGAGANGLAARPIYYYHADGLTPAQAVRKAIGIATDIAKREVSLTGKIEGLPSAKVHQNLILQVGQNGRLGGFEDREYTLTGVEHEYSVPEGGSGGGYFTNIRGMSIPQGVTGQAEGGGF